MTKFLGKFIVYEDPNPSAPIQMENWPVFDWVIGDCIVNVPKEQTDDSSKAD
jgi:hypothetical protein